VLIILIYRAFLSVLSVRTRLVKTDQSELFHKIALRNCMLLTRLERVRVGLNNTYIWCLWVSVSSVRARVLKTDQSDLFHKTAHSKWKLL